MRDNFERVQDRMCVSVIHQSEIAHATLRSHLRNSRALVLVTLCLMRYLAQAQ